MIPLALKSRISRLLAGVAGLTVIALCVLLLSSFNEGLAEEPPAPLAEPWSLEDPPRILPAPVPRIWLADFSPDGKLLVTTAGWHSASTPFGPGDTIENGELVFWDVAKREPRAMIMENNTIRASAFSPDGKLLAYCMYDGKVKLVDVAAAKVIKTLGSHKALANAVSFSPDGKTLVSCGFDQTLRFWDVKTGKATRTLKTECERITHIEFSPNGKKLATGDWQPPHTAQIWDVEKGEVEHTLTHAQPVEELNFSPDGTKLATASWDGHVVIWDVAKGEEVMRKEEGGRNGVMFSPDGKLLAACGLQVTVWNLPSGEQRWSTGGRDSIASVRFSPDGKMLAAAYRQNVVRLYDALSGAEITMLTRNEDPADEPAVVRAVAFSPNGKILATGGEAKQVQLRDATTGFVEETLKEFKDTIASLAFSPDGAVLATATMDGAVKLWDTAKWTEKLALPAAKEGSAALAFSPDGKTLATGGYDKAVRLFNTADGKEVMMLAKHEAAVRAIAFSPDGKRLASGSGDNTIILWNLETKSDIAALEGHTGAVRSVAFSPDGKLLASGGEDGKIRLWDSAGAVRGSIDAHRDMVWAVSFVDRGTLVSGGADGQLVVWDVETKDQRQRLAAHTDALTSLAVSGESRRVATGGLDRTIKIWKAKEKAE